MRLPDGSKVWLNAASRITYATSLNERGERLVKLESGEAYFEVMKDKKHPFIVKTSLQEVQVLGTHFNINTYADELNTKTTLLEGSVRIHSVKGQNVILKPGQQSILSANVWKVANVSTDEIIAWKNGLFTFNETDIPTIMRQISRWYDVDVEYSGNVPTDLISGGIARSSKISTVMKMLEMVNIHYQIVQEGSRKKIIINP